MRLTRDEVIDAASAIGGRVRRTPVAEAAPGVWLKLECLQHSGSFKVRGAFNRILAADLPAAGVIAASGGNHGLAVAYAARALGIRAEIFVPEVCAAVKIAGLRALGAEVVVTGAIYADALDASRKRAAETGALELHAYDQREVVAGQGTLALELEEQIPGLDTIVVAAGGGGLAGGVRAAFGGEVVVVEPELIPTIHEALSARQPVQVNVSGVGADALGASRAGQIALDVLQDRATSVLVTDEAIIEARRTLWRDHRIAAEHAGAAAYAALLSGAWEPAPGTTTAIVVCGSNTDPATLA
ncbi:pyridoxal-phosphate dependent enzyme [Herbidospora galbida]|uniref:threonine ammonia-lyase n=1 Tax=Herbidospora galbida TaxID=2575442 RepID=A0A4U3M5X1_9ACTN|nr:serine/threonine dehydratase [Herbidospora galbida]TKK83870.1 pyridoxal-phosphate dependent enzyme [Herbidospora galbida]